MGAYCWRERRESDYRVTPREGCSFFCLYSLVCEIMNTIEVATWETVSLIGSWGGLSWEELAQGEAL